MADDKLRGRFDDEMLRIYERALSEAHYRATRFLSMLSDHGGLETARILIHSPAVSEGYTALWQRGRLDLTVEAVIVIRRMAPTIHGRGACGLPETARRLRILAAIQEGLNVAKSAVGKHDGAAMLALRSNRRVCRSPLSAHSSFILHPPSANIK